jgi:hypothetical protein
MASTGIDGTYIGNTMRDMTDFSYGEQRLPKEKELNASMTINTNEALDSYGQKTRNVGGNS